MKTQLCFLCLGILLLAVSIPRHEGYKNVSYSAQNELEKIKTKILPLNALCIDGTQCQSGICKDNADKSLYGYCSATK